MTSKSVAFGFDHFWQPKPREHRRVHAHLPQLGFHVARALLRLDDTKQAAEPSSNLMGLYLTSTTYQVRSFAGAVVVHFQVFVEFGDVSTFSSSFGFRRQDWVSQCQPQLATMHTWQLKLHRIVEAFLHSADFCGKGYQPIANPSLQ